MAEINDLDVTDANNTGRFPENMAPSAVNDGARALEGIIARWHKDLNGSVLTTGTSTAYVYAANQTLSAYYDGLLLGVDFHTACGASPTINVDALGAKSLKWPNGTALASGDVATGQKALVVYDGADMIVLTAGGALSAQDSVATASIDDNAVTLAKLEDGTQGDVLYYGASGAPARLGAGTDGQYLQTQGAGANPQWADVTGITTATEQATTSGDTFDFTSIPSGTVRITIMFQGISLTSGDDLLVQIGDSGGIETTGYSGGSETTQSTSGWLVEIGGATRTVDGHMVLTLMDSANNGWVSSHTTYDSTNARAGAGYKELSGTLDRVRLTNSNTGVADFDAGSVNIMYE